jgi:ParB family chromosome partitioning protein
MPKPPPPRVSFRKPQAGRPLSEAAPIQAARGPRALPGALLLPLDQIVPDPDQPRRTFDAESLNDLSDSIARQGILQPLLVREDGYVDDGRVRYVIVAGERRWRAAQAAGLDAAPVVVRGTAADVDPVDTQELRVLQLIENLQRADLSPIEEARALHELQVARDLSVRHLAALVSRPTTYVQNRLALVALARDDDVAAAVESGRLTPSAAVEIQALPDPQRETVLGRVRTDPTYAPDVAALRRLKQPSPPATPVPNRNTPLAVDNVPSLGTALPPVAAVPNRNTLDAQPLATTTQAVDPHPLALVVGPLDAAAVDALLAYGEERSWSCAELARAIWELRSQGGRSAC